MTSGTAPRRAGSIVALDQSGDITDGGEMVDLEESGEALWGRAG